MRIMAVQALLAYFVGIVLGPCPMDVVLLVRMATKAERGDRGV